MAEEPRRLGDKIARAHEQAYEQGKSEVARGLLRALELELSHHGKAPEQRDSDPLIRQAYLLQAELDGST